MHRHPGGTKKAPKRKNNGILSLNEKTFDSTKLPTLWLPPDEYAMVMSEINSHLSDDARKDFVVTKRIGKYAYTFENYGFNEYRFIRKRRIDGADIDLLRSGKDESE